MKTMDTKVALAGYGTIDVRGRSILSGDEHAHDFWSMLSIAIGHREMTPDECEALDVMANVSCIGDPRLWPFRATRIVASFGDPYLGMAAGVAFHSGGRLSVPAGVLLMRQLQALTDEYGMEPSLDQVKEHLSARLERKEIIAGYNVVARPTDERHDFMKPWFQERGWYERGYMKLLLTVDAAMMELKGLLPNIISHWGALWLDLGFTPEQAAMMGLGATNWAMAGNIVEAAEPEFAGLRRMPDAWVAWKGAEDRQSPRVDPPS